MKLFIYSIIFTLLFLLFKAFYLDSLPSKSTPDNNITLQKESPSSEAVKAIKEEKVAKSQDKSIDSFFDELGDSIADKIKGKE